MPEPVHSVEGELEHDDSEIVEVVVDDTPMQIRPQLYIGGSHREDVPAVS